MIYLHNRSLNNHSRVLEHLIITSHPQTYGRVVTKLIDDGESSLYWHHHASGGNAGPKELTPNLHIKQCYTCVNYLSI